MPLQCLRLPLISNPWDYGAFGIDRLTAISTEPTTDWSADVQQGLFGSRIEFDDVPANGFLDWLGFVEVLELLEYVAELCIR